MRNKENTELERSGRPENSSQERRCAQCDDPIRGLHTYGPGETFARPCGCRVPLSEDPSVSREVQALFTIEQTHFSELIP